MTPFQAKPRPKRPEPNGNEFDNYVAASLDHLMAPGWFKGQITLGNILTLATILIAFVTMVVRGEEHMANKDVHQVRADREMAFDRDFSLHEAPMSAHMVAIDHRLEVLEAGQQKVLDSQDEIVRLLRKRLESYDRERSR